MMQATQKTSPWSESPLGELITGTAFHPHPADLSRSLEERFAGRNILLLVLAKERAAVARVSFREGKAPTVATVRQLLRGQAGELASALAEEAARSQAAWVQVSLACGWQAYVARRSSSLFDAADAHQRRHLVREQASLLLGRVSAEQVFTCIDHPSLDRSFWFSARQQDLLFAKQEIEMAGLGLAGVKIGVAALLEAWFVQNGEDAVKTNLLISDGLGSLYLEFNNGDPVCPGQSRPDQASMPRQSSMRPGDLVADMSRYLKDQGPNPVRFLGPREVEESLRVEAPGLVGLPEEESASGDPVAAVLSSEVCHDVGPDLRVFRAQLGRTVRGVFFAGALAGLLLMFASGGLLWKWNSERLAAQAVEVECARLGLQLADMDAQLSRQERDQERGLGLRAWLATHPKAQALALRLLQILPGTVALERISAQLDEGGGQMTLEFVLQGGEEAQLEALRGVERGLAGLGYRIGERSPVGVQAKGSLHHWRLILPGIEEITL